MRIPAQPMLHVVYFTEGCPALQGSWKGKSAIIGFFWAAAADCDFVMVTRGGLELYTLAADRQACPSRHCYVLNERDCSANTLK